MKKILLLTAVIFVFLTMQAAIVPHNDSTRKVKMEELKKLRKELFTKKLNLSAEEVSKFFPVYDEYQLKLKLVKKEFRKKWKQRNQEALTETEASEYLSDALKLRETELSLFKTYTEKLKAIISSRQIVQLHRVEKEVQAELMKRAREMKIGGGAAQGNNKKLKEKEKSKEKHPKD